VSSPVPVQTAFSRVISDKSRSDLPTDAAWDIRDFIPNLDAPLRRRGPYSVFGSTWGAGLGVQAYGLVLAGFATGPKVVVNTENGRLISYVPGVGTPTTITNAGVGSIDPYFYRELVIYPDMAGNNQSWYLNDAGVFQNMGLGSPFGKAGCSYKDHAVLAFSTAQPRRIWFAGAGTPTVWNTTDGWMEVDSAGVGVSPVRGGLLALQTDRVTLIRGDVPPPGPYDDFSKIDIGDQGCSDVRSIVSYKQSVIWANRNGIWISDGTEPWDLTTQAQVNQYWQSIQSSAGQVAATVYRGYLIITVEGAGVTLLFDIERRAMISRFSNMGEFSAFARSQSGGKEEVYIGATDSSRKIYTISSIWSPLSGNSDPNGSAIAPILETPMYALRGPSKRWRNIYLGYGLRTTGVFNAKFYTTPEAGAAAAATSSDLGSTGAQGQYLRKRIPCQPQGQRSGGQVRAQPALLSDR
jgi:hypothetical protein